VTDYELMVNNQSEIASIRGVLDTAGHALADGSYARAVELLEASDNAIHKLLDNLGKGTGGR